MKKIFAAAVAAGTLAALPAQAENITSFCQPNNATHSLNNALRDFTLTLNTETNKATLQGAVDLPASQFTYQFGPFAQIKNDGTRRHFEMAVVPQSSGERGPIQVQQEVDVKGMKSIAVHIPASPSWRQSVFYCPVGAPK